MSLDVAVLVCVAVARLRSRRLKSRQLEEVFNARHWPDMGIREQLAFSAAPPPPLPPPAYSPSNSLGWDSDGSAVRVVLGTPVQHQPGMSRPYKQMSFVTVALTCVAVAKFKRRRAQCKRQQGGGPPQTTVQQACLQRSDSFHSILGDSGSEPLSVAQHALQPSPPPPHHGQAAAPGRMKNAARHSTHALHIIGGGGSHPTSIRPVMAQAM